MDIIPAETSHIQACLEAVLNSKLGEVYYSDVEKTTRKFEKAIRERELFVALNDRKEVLGYCWIVPKGMFGHFPYLRSIAIQKKHRGTGIGKALLTFFEENGFKEFDRIYLLVSSFNSDARRLYEAMGYKEISVMYDCLIDGIHESIMCKQRV